MARAAFFDMDLTLLRVSSGSRWVKVPAPSVADRSADADSQRNLAAQYRLSLLDMESVAAMLAADMAGDSEADTRHKGGQNFIAPSYSTRFLPTRAPNLTSIGRTAMRLYCSRVRPVCGRAAGRGASRFPRPVCAACHRKRALFRSGDAARLLRQRQSAPRRAVAKAHGIDLGPERFFYTDSYSDLPMLLRVGRPVAVNPGSAAFALRSSTRLADFALVARYAGDKPHDPTVKVPDAQVLLPPAVARLIDLALDEDLGRGDVTSEAILVRETARPSFWPK